MNIKIASYSIFCALSSITFLLFATPIASARTRAKIASGVSPTSGSLVAYYNNEPVQIPVQRILGFNLEIAADFSDSSFEPYLSTNIQLADSLSRIDVVELTLAARRYFFQQPISSSTNKTSFLIAQQQVLKWYACTGVSVTSVNLSFFDADKLLQKVETRVGGISLGGGVDWSPNFLNANYSPYRFSDENALALRTEVVFNYAPVALDASPGYYTNFRLNFGVVF